MQKNDQKLHADINKVFTLHPLSSGSSGYKGQKQASPHHPYQHHFHWHCVSVQKQKTYSFENRNALAVCYMGKLF